jgi:hypothetical protein
MNSERLDVVKDNEKHLANDGKDSDDYDDSDDEGDMGDGGDDDIDCDSDAEWNN